MNTPTYIVGHDNSDHAAVAVDTAIKLGAPTRATLNIIYVRHNPPTLPASATATVAHEEALDAIVANLDANLTTQLADYPGEWQLEQRRGDPADELINAARQIGADAIIVGHRGHNMLTELLVGSVANRLVHHSPITIIVAR